MEEANKSVTPASFVCEKCKGTPSMDQIVQSASTYGLILLRDDKSTWLGFNCPLCEKPWTNIKKFKHEEIRQFGIELVNIIASNFGTLVYHSFPFSVHHPLNGPADTTRYMKQLELLVGQLGEETVYSGEPGHPDDRRKLYSSYSFGLNAFGPAIAIWWYRDEDIEKLASHESESGLRAFPRYRLYDSIYSPIDYFCWQDRLYLDYFIKETGSDDDWISFETPLSSTTNYLSKTFDFMYILDMHHLEDISGYPTSKKLFQDIKYEYSESLKKAVEIISYLSSAGNLDRGRERIRRELWANFTKDYIQDLLKQLSEKFIDEYIALSKRVDFSYKAVWELKEKYLSDLVKAIKSPIELQKSLQAAREYRRPKVLEAEKCFPGVKIISQNYEIDQLKIAISRLPESINKPDAFLILGERGTGKGMFAKAIHETFIRIGRKGENIKLDCGTMVETMFESELFGHVKGAFTDAIIHKGRLEKAENGTIFIDEIGNLPLSLQKAMLGFLQDWEFIPVGSEETKDVNAMVVLATNMDLKAEIKNGKFRADLYDRICHFEFEIPPLRNRKEDIPILINHFIKLYDEQRNEDHSLEEFTATSDCIKALTDFDWPGNVRQLEGVVKKIVKTRGGANDRSPIDVSDLPDWLSISSESEEQVLPKSIQPTDPIKNKYGRLPKDDSILIELKKQGKKGPEVAELYGVRPETVYRRYSEIRKKDQF